MHTFGVQYIEERAMEWMNDHWLQIHFFFLSFAAGACLKSCVFLNIFKTFQPQPIGRHSFIMWSGVTHRHLKQNFTKQYILSTLSNIFQCLYPVF